MVAAVADLMFGARVRAAAEAAGVPLTFVRSGEALLEAAAGARLVLLDLDTRWLRAGMISALKADAAARAAYVVAWGAHVDGAALTAAREAGADRVMARSAFVQVLPALMTGAR